MRWFSHRRNLSIRAGHAMVSSVAACCVPPTAQALLCIVNGGDSAVFRFFLVTLTFELGRDFCTLYLTVKFDRPTFSRREVVVRAVTGKQTPLKTSTSLRYATPVFQTVCVAVYFSPCTHSRRSAIQRTSVRCLPVCYCPGKSSLISDWRCAVYREQPVTCFVTPFMTSLSPPVAECVSGCKISARSRQLTDNDVVGWAGYGPRYLDQDGRSKFWWRMAIRITDRAPDCDTGKTCLGGGMHCPSGSSFCCFRTVTIIFVVLIIKGVSKCRRR